MIGSGLKNLAKEHNLQIDKGVAYGNLCGYATTLSEGAGFKQVQISTVFKDPQQQFQLQTLLNGRNLEKEFRVQQLVFSDILINIVFFDNPGTMKKIYAFIDYFFPLLDHYGASKANICTYCHSDITSGKWKLIGGTAYYLHDNCAQKIQNELLQKVQKQKEEDTGSYLSGFFGALFGAVIGSIVWGLIWLLGYVASIAGLAIGWLAEKGYTLLHGKQGTGKVAVLIITGIFGVVFGTVLGEIFTLFQLIGNGELYGFTYSDIPYIYSQILMDSEYVLSLLGSIGMGLLFAVLGMFALVRRTSKEVSDIKMIDLN